MPTESHPSHSLAGHLWLGMRGRCPRCGEGGVFDGFLQVAGQCPACGLRLSGHDAGDAPAVAATFVLGFVVIGLAAWVELTFEPPLWVHAILWIPTIGLGTLAVLRPLKGMTIALQYRYRAVDEPERLGGH